MFCHLGSEKNPPTDLVFGAGRNEHLNNHWVKQFYPLWLWLSLLLLNEHEVSHRYSGYVLLRYQC